MTNYWKVDMVICQAHFMLERSKAEFKFFFGKDIEIIYSYTQNNADVNVKFLLKVHQMDGKIEKKKHVLVLNGKENKDPSCLYMVAYLEVVIM